MTLIYKGVKGLRIRLETNYNLTGYVSLTTIIKMTKPDGTSVSLTPSSIDAANGYLYFTTTSTTFPDAGQYKFQAHFSSTSKELDGEIATVTIGEPITVV